jgi:tRNA(His) guanylyltransferase
MKQDIFGDRMKDLERVYTAQSVNPPSFMCVRIDGKGFSKFTKGFDKPFDDGLSEAMVSTAERLLIETHASVSYVQSDEITLIYEPNKDGHEYIFGGKTSKINSVLASMAAANFNYFIAKLSPIKYAGRGLAYFDCRTFSAPDEIEASNVLLWRVQDARKNSVSSLFRWTAGHRAMDGLDQLQMKDYLFEKHSVSWDNLPNRYKYGTYIKPVVREFGLSDEERNKIPEKNRPEANAVVKRSTVERVDIGYYGDLDLQNRIKFIKKEKVDE